MAQDRRIPGFLQGKKHLQREYLAEIQRASHRGCFKDCQKAEIDRKYAKLANPQASLERNRGKR